MKNNNSIHRNNHSSIGMVWSITFWIWFRKRIENFVRVALRYDAIPPQTKRGFSLLSSVHTILKISAVPSSLLRPAPNLSIVPETSMCVHTSEDLRPPINLDLAAVKWQAYYIHTYGIVTFEPPRRIHKSHVAAGRRPRVLPQIHKSENP